MSAIEKIKAKARADVKHIVLPEGAEPRTVQASAKILKEGVARVTLLGNPDEVRKVAAETGTDLTGVAIIDPATSEKSAAYADLLYELRKAKGMTPEQATELVTKNPLYYGAVMLKAGDADGMVAGQVLDTLYGIQTEEQLKAMYRLKTGVMISGAAELGCVAADMRAQAVEFADQLGLAFQIRDDMLDVVGDEQVFGKPIGSDKEEGKITYVDVDGLEGCARAVEACTRRAKDAVAQWPDHDFLFALADQLVDRNK